MNLILAAHTVINHPDMPPIDTSGLKDVLAGLVPGRSLMMLIFTVGILAFGLSKYGPWWLRGGALVLVGFLLLGWLDRSGVLLAAVGGNPAKVDQGLLIGFLGIVVALALLGVRGEKKRKTRNERKIEKLQHDLLLKQAKTAARKGSFKLGGGKS